MYLNPSIARAEIHVWLPAESVYVGEHNGDFAGSSVAGTGDVNGDGFDDFLVSAYHNSDAGVEAGKVYLVLGLAVNWPVELDLGQVDASFTGEAPGDSAGMVVDGAGDVNGDGFTDIVIAAPYNDDNGASAGQAYLCSGNSRGGRWGRASRMQTLRFSESAPVPI